MKHLYEYLLFLVVISIFFAAHHTFAYAQNNSDLNSYSLSFAPIRNWYPTAYNSVQQIDAAVWKDSDGDNVKKFTNLTAEWQFDSNFYQIRDTSSHYFNECPIERVDKRPCINFSVHVVTLNPGKTNVQLTLRDSAGGTVWNAEPAQIDDLSQGTVTPTINSSGLSTYSLSFESDPIRKWWPVAPNQNEDVTAGLWKDSDGTNVKRFTDLQAEWQFDPQYVSVAYTSSSYFDVCPVPTVSKRPCIYFYASIRPLRAGMTSVQLTVRDKTGEVTWNAYPMIIEDRSMPVTPTKTNGQGPTPTAVPTSVQLPTGREYKDLEQKIVMLEKQVHEQEVKLNETQNILQRLISFIRKVFRLAP